jgi:hypothetical protein
MKTKYIVTAKQDTQTGEWGYFIDSEYYQQKGFKTEAEAIRAGKNKVAELRKYADKKNK